MQVGQEYRLGRSTGEAGGAGGRSTEEVGVQKGKERQGGGQEYR